MLSRLVELPVYARWPFQPVRGAGCYLWDAEGRQMLDLYAGHAVALIGHAHPAVVAAVNRQASELMFYSNALPLAIRDTLVAQLASLAPSGLDRAFFVNSGAEANEQAVALARRATGRRHVVSIDGGFHGRTLATLSLSGIDAYRERARLAGGEPLIALTRHCPFDDAGVLEQLVDEDVAAVIVEPVQGLAGARDLSAEFLHRAREVCDATGAVLIFDEVQTGCGRTGAFTAGQLYGVVPDAITLAKGIASGLPLGALLVGTRLAEGIGLGDLGTTFGGAPVPCAAAAATLSVLAGERLAANAQSMGTTLRERLSSIPGVSRVTGRGLLLGVVLDRAAKPVQRALFERGVLVGSAHDAHTLRLLPPLVLEADHLSSFFEAIEEILG
ncbi:MAG: aspartate aminotransferase family protein [Acidobacteriota bacterium]|nr:MAG: aspartate aminotransferase family protein [Acidobacteriota bacterium]